MFFRKKKAVTLLELLLVIVIIAALVTGFIITFRTLHRRSQLKAAETMLRTILAAAKDYHVQYGYYPDDLTALYPRYMANPNALTTEGGRVWTYRITQGGGPDVFTAAAVGDQDTIVSGETGTIDEEGDEISW